MWIGSTDICVIFNVMKFDGTSLVVLSAKIYIKKLSRPCFGSFMQRLLYFPIPIPFPSCRGNLVHK